MSARAFSSILGLALLVSSAPSHGQESVDAQLEKVGAHIGEGEITDAAQLLEQTRARSMDPAQTKKATDLLAQVEVMSNRPYDGLVIFRELHTSPGGSVDHSRHISNEVRIISECAQKLGQANASPTRIEAEVRRQLKVPPGADLNVPLVNVMNRMAWRCPEIPPEPPVVVTDTDGKAGVMTSSDLGLEASTEPVRLRTYAYVAGGVAVASAATAGLLGYMAYKKADGAEAATWDADIDTARSFATGTNIAWGIAGGAAAAAVALWLLDDTPDEPEAMTILPTGNGLFVSF